MSWGGSLSTDSSVKRQKRFQSALRKFQHFTGSLWAGTLSFGGIIREGRCCERRKGRPMLWMQELSRLVVGFPDKNMWRPSLGWRKLSIMKRRNWLFPFGYITVQGCWMLPRSPGSHHQEMFFVTPVDILAVEVTNIQTGVWECRDNRWFKSRASKFVDVNSLASARFQGFSQKTPKCTWLCARISPVGYALQTR